MEAKICGVKDINTLKYIINHKYPPKFIGFIVNYKKSKRYVKIEKLKKLNDEYKFLLSNANSNIGAAKLLKEEKQFQYNLNNIEIFNYLIGIILLLSKTLT